MWRPRGPRQRAMRPATGPCRHRGRGAAGAFLPAWRYAESQLSKRCAIGCGGDGGVDPPSRDPFAANADEVRAMSRRRSLPGSAILLVLFLTTACARVYPHVALPALALGEPSFFPTLEAYASAPIVGGNRADVLLNGEQIFPAIVDAIRSAKKTVTYAQYFYEDGPVAREVAEALAERCRDGVG